MAEGVDNAAADAFLLYCYFNAGWVTGEYAFVESELGTVDNVLRFTLLKRLGNVHPLTTVFGVIIGLSLFGFIGLIFGPLLISLFMLLLKIYSNEFITKQRNIIKIMEN